MEVTNKKKNYQFIIIIITIIVLIFLLGKCVPKNNETKDTVRCSYCSKVIRSGGKNIHGKPIYNGNTLECDYCGHKTNIN